MTSSDILPPDYPVIVLRPKEDKRIRQGHQWVYSNEVDTRKTPLSQFWAGQLAVVQAADGKVLGVASLNPHSLICARLLSRQVEPINRDFFRRRLHSALRLREAFYEQPYYRLVFGDSDFLSGLVVDRFGDVLVVQISTAGMEPLRELIVDVLDELLQPKAILLKNDSGSRQQEGLPVYVEDAKGTTPELVALYENGVRFEAPVRAGQKTGWFYDHRPGRAKLMGLSRDKRVLDLFSYVGGWGLQAAAAGASAITCVDSSDFALQLVAHNAAAQGVAPRVNTMKGDVFNVLEQLHSEGQRFDVVVADPPAFIKRRKDAGQGLQAYRRLNAMATRVLAPDGLLVAASCSMHLARTDLIDVVRSASAQAGRFARLVDHCGQGPDHPIHPAIIETEYLKAMFVHMASAE